MPKTVKERRLRTRIILVFFGAVMLPSLVMAYLGMRYIRQEEQRQEQIVTRGLQVTLEGISRKTEEGIIESVNSTFDSLLIYVSQFERTESYRTHQFTANNPLVEEVFLMDKNLQLIYPRTFRNNIEAKSFQKEMAAGLWQRVVSGERSEAGGNYTKAISSYELGLYDCRNSKERLTFLVRIARCEFKAGNYDKAINTYHQVLREDNGRFLGEEVPYPFIATFQLVDILDKRARQIEAFEVLTGL